ncbi:MAG: hypothetical protein Q4C96_08570 [Planctomycetia bacterium]|nr:hypothetical protein [Planctomycetia bacterium]
MTDIKKITSSVKSRAENVFWPFFSGFFFTFFFLSCVYAQTETKHFPELEPTHGQIWRVYDISHYTSKIQNTAKPETAVLDWILLETGFEIWHSEISAMLTVTPSEVRVFHVPAVQEKVSSLISRLVNVDPEHHVFQVQLFIVRNPHWRQKISKELTPISSYPAGSQAWEIAAENLKKVITNFEDTPGFSRLSTQAMMIFNGQAHVISLGRTRDYVRNYYVRPGMRNPTEEKMILDDGFSFELMPLLSLDGGTIDAQLKCQIDHLERFISFYITPAGGIPGREDQKISVPVVSQFRFRERYKWDAQKSLLVSFGITPSPTPTGNETRTGVLGLNPGPRVEMFALIEYRNRK